MTTFKTLDVNDVPYLNKDNMSFSCKPTIIGITDNWLIAQVYTDNPEKCFYLFNFASKAWSLLQHNLPTFCHQTCIIFRGQYFVVHGTENREHMIYRTYIGSLDAITEGSPITFHFAAILQTPDILNGEHRLVVGNDNLYVLSGYDVTRSREATVHSFHPQFKIWDLIYRAHSLLNSVPPPENYQPPRENCILYYDGKLYVFPNTRERCINDFSAYYKMLPKHVAVFDLERFHWTSRSVMLQSWDLPRQPPSSVTRRRAFQRYTVTDECSLAQCPRQPWLVYVTLSNASSAAGPVWDTWLMDLSKDHWERLVVTVRGPPMPRPVALVTAITPGGEMYAVRSSQDPDARRHVFRTRIRCGTPPPRPDGATAADQPGTTPRPGPAGSSYHAAQKSR